MLCNLEGGGITCGQKKSKNAPAVVKGAPAVDKT